MFQATACNIQTDPSTCVFRCEMLPCRVLRIQELYSLTQDSKRATVCPEAPPVSGELQVNYGAPTCINTKKTYLRNIKELQGTWIDRGQHQ